MVCARCEAEFRPRRPWARFCSTSCREAAKYRRKKAAGYYRRPEVLARNRAYKASLSPAARAIYR